MQLQFITLHKKAKDLTGQRFGRLVALGPIERVSDHAKWLCQCDCGNTASVLTAALRSGNTQSCGCLRRELEGPRATTHGMSKSRIYRVWRHMVDRCINPTDGGYKHYGARGIAVFCEWKNSFESFHAYVAHLPNYDTPGYSLDRIDNDGNYEPGNVQWSSHKNQTRNRRSNHLITWDGKTQCITAWAEELNMNPATLQRRIRSGWSAERALLTPVGK